MPYSVSRCSRLSSVPGAETIRAGTGKASSGKGEENEVLEIDSILTYCMNCKRCDMACPHGVKPAFYNTKNKQNLETGIQEKVRDWILAHNVWWGKIASKIPGFSNFASEFSSGKNRYVSNGACRKRSVLLIER